MKDRTWQAFFSPAARCLRGLFLPAETQARRHRTDEVSLRKVTLSACQNLSTMLRNGARTSVPHCEHMLDIACQEVYHALRGPAICDSEW